MMKRFAHKDLVLLLDYIRDVYAFRDVQDFRSHVVDSASTLIPVDVAVYNELHLFEEAKFYQMAPLSFPVRKDAPEVFQYHHFQDREFTLKHFQHQFNFATYRTTELQSRFEMEHWGFFQNFYLPHHIPYTLVTNLHSEPEKTFPLSLHRELKEFSDREVSILEVAGPHLRMAFTHSLHVTNLQTAIHSLQDGLEASSQPIVAVDSQGGILWSTPSALNCLTRLGSFAKHQPTRLPSPFLEWVQHQNRLLDTPDTALSANPQLNIEKNGHHLTIRLVRQGNHRILFLEEHSPTPSVENLRHYGLTTREREVAGWVVRGKSNVDIAKILGISPETVHRHLGSVYLRLGIKSRGDILMKLQEGE